MNPYRDYMTKVALSKMPAPPKPTVGKMPNVQSAKPPATKPATPSPMPAPPRGGTDPHEKFLAPPERHF